MKDRDLLLGSLDIALAFLVVFLLTFLAIRYDESAGPYGELTRLDIVELANPGDFSGNQFLGIMIDDKKIIVSQMTDDMWTEIKDLSGPGWQSQLRNYLRQSNLPVVVYEINSKSPMFGDVVREAVEANRSIGLNIQH